MKPGHIYDWASIFLSGDGILIAASLKTTKSRILGTVSIILAIIIGTLLFCFGGNSDKNASETISRHVTDNDSRKTYLASKGLKTADEPDSVTDILIPDEFDEVLNGYNELQLESGFDISPYLGKTVKKYVYKVTNYEDGDEIYAALYVYNDTVIAADISSYKDSWQRSIDETGN